MSEATAEIIEILTGKYKLLRLELGKRNCLSYFVTIYMLASRIMQIYCAGWLIARNMHEFLLIATGAKSIVVNFHGTKVFVLIHESELIYLIESLKHFWTSESTERIYAMCLKFTKIFQYSIMVSFIFVMIMPVVFGHYPFDGYYPPFPGSFWVFAIMQLVQFAYDVIVVFAVDCSFLCFSVLLYGQLKLLNEHYERIADCENEEEAFAEADKCINHHNFILKLVKIYNDVFSYTLFSQYFITTITICIEMFVFNKQDAVGMTKSVFYLTALLFQLSLQCFPADFVIQESASTSQAIMNSKWYNLPKFAKTYLQNVMQVSQKDIIIRGGGFVEINRVAFTKIFKWSLSLSAMLRDLDEIIA